jgi:hypothetical protein
LALVVHQTPTDLTQYSHQLHQQVVAEVVISVPYQHQAVLAVVAVVKVLTQVLQVQLIKVLLVVLVVMAHLLM